MFVFSHEEKEEKNSKDFKERWRERKQVSTYYWNVWREEYLTTLLKLTKNYCAKRDLNEGEVVLDLVNRRNKLERPKRIVHEAFKARIPGEKEPKVRSVWLRHSIPADKVTDEGKHLTQHKYTRGGIEQVSLEESLEETSTLSYKSYSS